MFGLLNIYKPKGITSHDVISKLRKIFKIKQIGHTGTLDPMAEGVLPVCVGKATKLIQYLDDTKAYRAFIKLGIKTDSYDLEGEVIHSQKVSLDENLVKEALSTFEGEIVQKPPIYSAIHYKGKRLYEYARKNIEVEDIPTRKVVIKKIELIDIQEKESSNPVLVVDIDCSSGTYIRSIAYDLGEILGCGAVLSGLIRTRAANFLVKDSYSLEDIDKTFQEGKMSEILINPLDVLSMIKIEINEEILQKIKYGQYFTLNGVNLAEDDKVLLIYNGNLSSVAEFNDGYLHPKNVFL